MAREKLKDLVEAAPDMTQELWDELSDLLRKRTCVQAFLRNMLVLAQDKADLLVNISTATAEGQEQNALCRGGASALQTYVHSALGVMGDAAEEELEALAEAKEEQEEQEGRTPTRRTRKPVKKVLRKSTIRKARK